MLSNGCNLMGRLVTVYRTNNQRLPRTTTTQSRALPNLKVAQRSDCNERIKILSITYNPFHLIIYINSIQKVLQTQLLDHFT